MRLFKSEDEGLVLLSKRELERVKEGEGGRGCKCARKTLLELLGRWFKSRRVFGSVKQRLLRTMILLLGQLRFKAWMRAKLLWAFVTVS